MDIRLKNLSYSSNLLLHACPRKYQLYKLNAEEIDEDGDTATAESVTFAFGHAVGTGIQSTLEDKTPEQVLWDMFLSWDAPLWDDDDKRKKSFSLAIAAVEKFTAARTNGLLKGYKLATYQGKPAVELSFIIHFPNGFKYRGFVDAVLVHEQTGQVLVLELKTTAAKNILAGTYKNSAQAIGYSIVLDAIFPTLSQYTVYYLIYKTLEMEYETMDFPKDYLLRALWIRELLLDIDTIKMYENAGIYPMHGESCVQFYRECKYLGICTLPAARLTKPLTEAHEKQILESHSHFQISLTLQDLIDAQLAKGV